MYSTIVDDTRNLLEKLTARNIKIDRTNLSDKIDIALLRTVNDSVLETRINGEEILYFSGKFVGAEIIKNYRKNIKGITEILAEVKKLFKKLMIGIIRDVNFDKEKILIHIDECAFCKQGRYPMENLKCHFLAGLISGIISKGTGHSCTGKETACRSIGDPFCTFEITLKNKYFKI